MHTTLRNHFIFSYIEVKNSTMLPASMPPLLTNGPVVTTLMASGATGQGAQQ